MKELNNYISEKLKINKDSNIDSFEANLEEEIINYLTGKLHYEYKEDYEFSIKLPLKNITGIIYKVVINLHSNIFDGNMSNTDFSNFSNFIGEHLNTVFKDKKFTYNCDLKLKEIDIYVRNKE